jgi:hypothetical protein
MRELVKGVTTIVSTKHTSQCSSLYKYGGYGVYIGTLEGAPQWRSANGDIFSWGINQGGGDNWQFGEDVKPQIGYGGDLDVMHTIIPSDVSKNSEWSAKHYDHYYHLTPEDISEGKIRLDAYTVSKVWKIGSKDDSGALWHTFKLFPRWGEKNTVEREIKALYAQTKALAKIYNVELED